MESANTLSNKDATRSKCMPPSAPQLEAVGNHGLRAAHRVELNTQTDDRVVDLKRPGLELHLGRWPRLRVALRFERAGRRFQANLPECVGHRACVGVFHVESVAFDPDSEKWNVQFGQVSTNVGGNAINFDKHWPGTHELGSNRYTAEL